MLRVFAILIYIAIGLLIAAYLAMWVLAWGLGCLNFQGELEGARRDVTPALLWIGAIGGMFLLPVIFALPLFHRPR